MRLAINAVSAKTGGAVTYLQNMLPALRTKLGAPSDEIVVWRANGATADERWPTGVEYRQDASASGLVDGGGSALKRLWFDQVSLPTSLRREHFDVLFSSANFGTLLCPCRQLLLVRNTAYFDPTLLSRMASPRVRAFYAAQRWLTLRSIAAAEVVLFPSQAMMDLVAEHAGGARPNWRVAHYGTRHDLFRPAPALPSELSCEVLNVGLYSDQKNLGTLMSAVESLSKSEPRRFRLTLTADFTQTWAEDSPYHPNFRTEREIFRRLERAGIAADTEWRRYGTLPDLYRRARVFVFPSYTESFGHPLVEAMASGLPVVAADVPINRELCGDAAEYFPPFDPAACADAIRRVVDDESLSGRLREASLVRARDFVWERHVEILVDALR